MLRGSNPGGGEIFCTCPDRSWSSPSLLYNGYRVFPRRKEWPGHDADPSPPSSVVVIKGRAILLLPLWAVRPVQSLSACTRVTFTFLPALDHGDIRWTPCHFVVQRGILLEHHTHTYTQHALTKTLEDAECHSSLKHSHIRHLPSPVLQPVDVGRVQNLADMFLVGRKTSTFRCTRARLEQVSVPSESQTLIHVNDLPSLMSCSDLYLQTITHQADYSSGRM